MPGMATHTRYPIRMDPGLSDAGTRTVVFVMGWDK